MDLLMGEVISGFRQGWAFKQSGLGRVEPERRGHRLKIHACAGLYVKHCPDSHSQRKSSSVAFLCNTQLTDTWDTNVPIWL